MMHGREPVHHLWPLNHFFPNVDISDPHTFLAIKRGILQYAWLKPILGVAAIIMKSTGTYQEGYLGLSSGYLWSGIAYNISVTVSLYSLGMFWVCMSKDLQPFRPVPKFLCIKLIIFASYWQGFFLSILVWLGAIPDDVKDYTPDNIAAAIQDTLICIEMPIFAVAHWYAFSWQDYVDASVSAARMPVLYAIRDAFGIRDLIEDTKETFSGNKYEYRLFDSGDNVIAHEGSSSRVARMMEGMRYERGGKGKYWIPRPGTTSRTPLLGDRGGPSRIRSLSQSDSQYLYGNGDIEEASLDPDEERLYETARGLKYGDYNVCHAPLMIMTSIAFSDRIQYHVITAQEAPRGHIRNSDLLTTSSTRNLPEQTEDSAIRRASDMSVAAENVARKGQSKHKKTSSRAKKRDGNSKGKQVASSRGGEQEQAPLLKGRLQHQHSGSGSTKSDPNQRVDLIVEDKVAEDRERDRARREGSAGWNETPPKQFVFVLRRQCTESRLIKLIVERIVKTLRRMPRLVISPRVRPPVSIPRGLARTSSVWVMMMKAGMKGIRRTTLKSHDSGTRLERPILFDSQTTAWPVRHLRTSGTEKQPKRDRTMIDCG
jgi:hypothetical protein